MVRTKTGEEGWGRVLTWQWESRRLTIIRGRSILTKIGQNLKFIWDPLNFLLRILDPLFFCPKIWDPLKTLRAGIPHQKCPPPLSLSLNYYHDSDLPCGELKCIVTRLLSAMEYITESELRNDAIENESKIRRKKSINRKDGKKTKIDKEKDWHWKLSRKTKKPLKISKKERKKSGKIKI